MRIVPGHVETAIHAAYFECRNGGSSASNGSLSNGPAKKAVSVASEILKRAIDSIVSTDSKAILSTHHAKVLSNIGREYDAARDVYRHSISLYPGSKYLVYSYFLFELSLRGMLLQKAYPADGDNDVLQKAWQIVKGSTIPDVKKNDLSQLLLQTMMERGCPLVIMRRIERACDLLVKESVDALVAMDAAAAAAEEMKENGEASRKMQKAADGSRVVAGKSSSSSSWNF
jgi:hypothetical protein